jgi:hypothetical protein
MSLHHKAPPVASTRRLDPPPPPPETAFRVRVSSFICCHLIVALIFSSFDRDECIFGKTEELHSRPVF